MADEKETTVREEQASEPGRSNRFKLLSIGAALASFALIYWFLPVADTDAHTAAEVRTGLAILALAAILWLTEAIPLAITALLVPVVAVLTGVFSGDPTATVTQAFARFADPLIFLFLGGFGIAAALTRQGLSGWLANGILSFAKGRFYLTCCLLYTSPSPRDRG